MISLLVLLISAEIIAVMLAAGLDIGTHTRRAERQPNFTDGGLQCIFHSGGALDLLTDGIDQRFQVGLRLWIVQTSARFEWRWRLVLPVWSGY